MYNVSHIIYCGRWHKSRNDRRAPAGLLSECAAYAQQHSALGSWVIPPVRFVILIFKCGIWSVCGALPAVCASMHVSSCVFFLRMKVLCVCVFVS